jgi:uncharacterized repeat protein (TIGR01451 family)
VTWNLGTLQPRDARTVTLRVMPESAGTFRNVATAQAYCNDPVSDDCSTEVTGISAVLLEVVDLEDPIEIGNEETYVITVTNQGSAPDTNIEIVCMLEDTQTYVSSSGATRGTAQGQRIVFAALPSLAPGQRATWRVVVKAVAAGDTRFSVQMDTDQLTRPVQENESTNLYE